MNFEEKLNEVVNSFLREEGLDGIISALELKLIELRVQEREVTCVLVTGPIGTMALPD
ncbi:hypothetical protein [Bradyrhizobium sp. Ai1a-2]|uniref:hypothetical protein n=1 Tax=Bradyrhizobium sp. Ai1a-2 TaxID=196490 RepID=UPI00041D489A|nr:hypothetical protein [Bradyrhizobium sp. Ai1a-2]